MSDIFQDIDEDLRRENLKKTVRKAVPWVSAAALALVIGVASWTGYEWYAQSHTDEASVKYQSALDLAQQGKFSEADTVFMDLANTGPKGYATLSRFRHASINAIVEPSKGYEEFDALSNDSNLSSDLRDLARIRSAQLLLEKGNYQDIATRINTLAENPSNAWRHAAREILTLAAWKIGNEDDARRWGQMVLSDFNAPSGTRGRAQLVLDLVGDAKQPLSASKQQAIPQTVDGTAESAPATAAPAQP